MAEGSLLSSSSDNTSALNRLNRALLVITGANHALLQSTHEAQLLNEVCRLAVGVGGYKMAWIGYVVHDEAQSIRPVASAGFDDGYLETVRISWGDNELGRGPGGCSVRTGKTVIARITSDPAFEAWREEATQRGYKANIALPLTVEGGVIGYLGIYASDAEAFDDSEVKILEDLSNDLALGINLLRTRAKRDQAEKNAVDLKSALSATMIDSMNNEILFRTLFDNAPMGIARLNTNLKYLSVNDAFAAMLEYSHAELQAMTLDDVTHPDDRAATHEVVASIQKFKQSVRRFQKRYVTKSGKTVWARVSSREIKFDGAIPYQLISIIEDISDIHELETKMEMEKRKVIQSAKLATLGEMSTAIAHEISNPLTVISAATSLLKRNTDNPETLKANIKLVQQSVEKVSKIVQGLRNFGRSSAYSEFKSMSFADIIFESIRMTESQSKTHATPIKFTSNSKAEIFCNEIEIEQVLINLIVNGIHAVKDIAERWVEISLDENETEVVVRIQDSGPGIAEDIASRIFEPFFTTKPLGEGTGLGLSIAKSILDAHKASIALVKNHPHTCFEIRFPKVKAAGASKKI